MSQNTRLLAQPKRHFFTRSKDTHQENDTVFITLFVRLTREHVKFDKANMYKETESVWVDINELKMKQATEKIRLLPNGIRTYAISEDIFQELVHLSTRCPRELYFVTPIYESHKFSRFG